MKDSDFKVQDASFSQTPYIDRGEDEQQQLAKLFSSNGEAPSNILIRPIESNPTSFNESHSRVEATGGGFKPKDNRNDIQDEIETLLNNDKMFGKRMMEKQIKVGLATNSLINNKPQPGESTKAYLNSARKHTATLPANHTAYGNSSNRLAQKQNKQMA